ncbi:MAG: sugar phosphate nucleotidyltransferase [Firmicutes bacterium]|nr:sugar phosphate nucleotidyltransferase [Bacillota bacterium]
MANTKITKAIITCGGYATRFLPITKAIPKEMLPIGNKPIIHYIVEELKDAGITDILILIGRGREVVQNYFDRHPELETVIHEKGMNININPFADLNITYKRVPMPRGAADNIWHAKTFAGNEPFVVAYSDTVFFEHNPTIELITDFEQHKKSTIIASPIPTGNTHKYGIIDTGIKGACATGTCFIKRAFQIKQIIEKPQSNPPSNLASCGRFVLTPEIFAMIENAQTESGEVCMTEQLNKVAGHGNLRGVRTRARCFDTGNPQGWFEVNEYLTKK